MFRLFDACVCSRHHKTALSRSESPSSAFYRLVPRSATKDQNPANLPSGVSRLVKRADADTTLYNAVRNGTEWAWVPHGYTCPFCITLTSRGWQTASKKLLKNGHTEHIHSNCDCEFAVRFRSDTTVAGYDPEKYLRQYRAATTNSAVRLRAARQSLAQFTQATGGRVDSARVSVPKFGRSEASRASAQARKASSTYSSLNTKAKPVTMQSIANVKAFSCDTLDAAGQQQLKNAHKRLLMVASKQPENVEVGKVFDIKMKPLTKDITGSAEGSSVRLPNFDTPYVVIHTHPACGIFSHGDLSSFTRNKNLKLMTAIGHNGHIYAIEKSINYDAAAANGIVGDLNAEIARLKNIPRAELPDDQLLEQAEKLIRQAIGDLQENGVKYYE